MARFEKAGKLLGRNRVEDRVGNPGARDCAQDNLPARNFGQDGPAQLPGSSQQCLGAAHTVWAATQNQLPAFKDAANDRRL